MILRKISIGGIIFSSFRNSSRYSTSAMVMTRSEQASAAACAQARAFDFNDFEAWLTTGGDDRSLILKTSGANKYHITPRPIAKGSIFRGSCTGNPPTYRGYQAALKLFESLKDMLGEEKREDLDKALREVFQSQRRRLKEYLQLENTGTQIILCPSGSDAEYLPVAIARALHQDKKIVNGVTQVNEIGAGSAPAAVGKLFSTHAPFLGEIGKGLEVLDGFDGIGGNLLNARDENGNLNDASVEMKKFQEEQIALGNFPIVHGVFGGKTGARDTMMPGSLDGGGLSLGVVDACQGRFSLKELHQWLAQDSIVLFTSSKFFQSPPFCGAVLVPKAICEKLAGEDVPIKMLGEEGLGAFVTDKELPSSLEHWKSHLYDPGRNNVGLALRWEAGLATMKALVDISDEDKEKVTQEWAASVKDMVDSHDFLETFGVERSIVSIRMRKAAGGYLNMNEARDLFRWMSCDVASVVPNASSEEKTALSTIAYTGQPVKITSDQAIIRIALGAESLLSYFEDKERTLSEDRLTVEKIGALSKHFDELKATQF